MRVKNTFVHVPSGVSPTANQGSENYSLLSAPANMIGRLSWPTIFGSAPSTPKSPSPSKPGEPQDTPSTVVDNSSTVYTGASPSTNKEDTHAGGSSHEGEEQHDDVESLDSEPHLEENDLFLSSLSSAARAPRPPPGALHPSLGSAGHSTGTCRRCCFFPRGRCANGYSCEFCHYEHDRRKRKNRSKKRTAWIAPPPVTAIAPAPAQNRHGVPPGSTVTLTQQVPMPMSMPQGSVGFSQHTVVTNTDPNGVGGPVQMPVLMHIIRPCHQHMMMYNTGHGIPPPPAVQSAPRVPPPTTMQRNSAVSSGACSNPSSQVIRLMPAVM